MTLKELSSLYYKKKLIARNEERISQMKASLYKSPQFDTSGTPRNPTPRNSTEELNIAISAAVEALEEEKAQFELEKIRLEEFIKTAVVDDELLRLILLYRFVDLMKWDKVADKLGGNNTEGSVKQMCYRFLKESEKNKTCSKCSEDMCYNDSVKS